MTAPKLLTISGSLRKGSFNRMLLKEAARVFGEAEVTEADLHLPLYDGDLEDADGIPAGVKLLAEQIREADAIVVSTPEYNKGISGVLKNALDWVSRVEGAVLRGKPTVVLAAAAGRGGGEVSYFMTSHCLMQLQVQLMPGTAVLIAGAMNAFDDDGKLINEMSLKTLTTRMQVLRAAVS